MMQITKWPHVYTKSNGGFENHQISYPYSKNTPFRYTDNPSKAFLFFFFLKTDWDNIFFAYIHIGTLVYSVFYINVKITIWHPDTWTVPDTAKTVPENIWIGKYKDPWKYTKIPHDMFGYNNKSFVKSLWSAWRFLTKCNIQKPDKNWVRSKCFDKIHVQSRDQPRYTLPLRN